MNTVGLSEAMTDRSLYRPDTFRQYAPRPSFQIERGGDELARVYYADFSFYITVKENVATIEADQREFYGAVEIRGLYETFCRAELNVPVEL